MNKDSYFFILIINNYCWVGSKCIVLHICYVYQCVLVLPLPSSIHSFPFLIFFYYNFSIESL